MLGGGKSSLKDCLQQLTIVKFISKTQEISDLGLDIKRNNHDQPNFKRSSLNHGLQK